MPRQKVYACFVDFRKAFDTVPSSRLIRRLQEMHIPESIIWRVMSLYESVQDRVRAPGGLSGWIKSTIGVEQGYPLSLTLFGLYINEITSFIDWFGGMGLPLADLMIHIVLYAYDIVLLSSLAKGL